MKCPNCDAELRDGELTEHVKACVALNEPRFTLSTDPDAVFKKPVVSARKPSLDYYDER